MPLWKYHGRGRRSWRWTESSGEDALPDVQTCTGWNIGPRLGKLKSFIWEAIRIHYYTVGQGTCIQVHLMRLTDHLFNFVSVCGPLRPSRAKAGPAAEKNSIYPVKFPNQQNFSKYT